MLDVQYDRFQSILPELDHAYGPNVHILSDPFLLSLLARLCAPETEQPWIGILVREIYERLFGTVIAHEVPLVKRAIATRMKAQHPEAVFEGPVLDDAQSFVTVNLARAGTLPSQVFYEKLNLFLSPKRVRQDHVSIARTTDTSHHVTGSQVSGHKLGGETKGSTLFFPDPMGATGSTIAEAMKLYSKTGKPRKAVGVHCIVTPEFLRKVKAECPEMVIYAIRLDRGLSPPEVLREKPGKMWEKEKGLNDQHYIVPGGGGFGELLNNAFV